MSVGDRIRDLRGDLLQQDLAKRLSVSKMIIGRWERGERVPGQDDLVKILECFPETNPAWLLTGQGPMRPHGAGVVTEELQEYGRGGQALDLERLRLAIEAIEEALQSTGRAMRPDKKAEMVAATYEFFGGEERQDAKAKVIRLLKTAI